MHRLPVRFAVNSKGFSGDSRAGRRRAFAGRWLRLGAPAWLRRSGPAAGQLIDALQRAGKTVVVLVEDRTRRRGRAGAAGHCRSVARDFAAAVARLKSMGLRVVMLTGDNAATAAAIASRSWHR
jgi:Cu+-exporting ATPase